MVGDTLNQSAGWGEPIPAAGKIEAAIGRRS
jgi:hypothetical protein